MRKLSLFAQVFLLLSCLCFYSCENTDNTEGVEQEALPPETIEAMKLFKDKGTVATRHAPDIIASYRQYTFSDGSTRNVDREESNDFARLEFVTNIS